MEQNVKYSVFAFSFDTCIKIILTTGEPLGQWWGLPRSLNKMIDDHDVINS